jgi:hypothetical protein
LHSRARTVAITLANPLEGFGRGLKGDRRFNIRSFVQLAELSGRDGNDPVRLKIIQTHAP